MGYDKRKRTRQCPDSDISDFDDSTQPPTRKRTRQCPDSDISDFDDSTQPPTSLNEIPTQHFPRFILVEGKDENRQITSLPTFLIQKITQSIACEHENIKKKLHRPNQLLI